MQQQVDRLVDTTDKRTDHSQVDTDWWAEDRRRQNDGQTHRLMDRLVDM